MFKRMSLKMEAIMQSQILQQGKILFDGVATGHNV